MISEECKEIWSWEKGTGEEWEQRPTGKGQAREDVCVLWTRLS
jgi:hypothetical protein